MEESKKNKIWMIISIVAIIVIIVLAVMLINNNIVTRSVNKIYKQNA